jgi:hypothetical protein
MADQYSRTYSFPEDKISYIVPSWSELADIVFSIAQQIQSEKMEFKRIVSLAKGGWPTARMLADFLHIRDGSSIGAKLYTGIDSRVEEPEVYQDLDSVEGEDLLLFDDVSDTGQTLKFVYDHLIKRGAASVTTATVYYKPHSVFKPHFFGQTTESWIVFPYEIVEMIRLLDGKWSKAGIPDQEINQRMEQLGFKTSWVEYYRGKGRT